MKLKTAAIILILSALILILPNFVSAANACCEKTTSGEWCAYVDESQCNTQYKSTFASCEQTSYCATGCCSSSDTGQCFKNTAKEACTQVKGAQWDENKNCEIPQCNLGCCLLGDQAIYTTEVKCKKTASQFEELEFKFDSTIKTEALCVAAAKSQDTGCCVKSDSAKFTTRGECGATITVKSNETTSSPGFYKDMLCSNDRLRTNCAKQSTTKCFGEDLYWVDSCGNKENIYNSEKEASYNKGFTLKESESCTLSGPGDTSCGNCDYPKGSICGKDSKKAMPVGTSICTNLACEKTYDDPVGASVNADGTKKKNGESWCAYDSMPGNGLDAVGSRHYRLMCVNGEEIVDPCKDFREEICIQGVLDETGRQQAATTYESFFSKGDYVEAACRTNQWSSCTSCNNKEWADEKTGQCGESCQKKRKDCCENPLGDCYWKESTISAKDSPTKQEETEGYCSPQVPPGGKFWAEAKKTAKATAPKATTTKTATTTKETTPAATADTPKTSATTACSQMQPAECQVVYTRGGWERIGSEIGGNKQAGWTIVANQKCTTKEYLLMTNEICRSMGDCGAHFNVLGKATLDGYHNTVSDETIHLQREAQTKLKLTEADLGKWNELTGPPDASPKGPDFMNSFTRNPAEIGMFVGGALSLLGSGLIGGVYGAGGFFSAFATGVAGVPYALAGATAPGATTGAALTSAYGAVQIEAAKVAVKTAGEELAKATADQALKQTALQEAEKAAANIAEEGVTAAAADAKVTLAKTTLEQASKAVTEATAKDTAAKTTLESTSSTTTTTTLGSALNVAMWVYMVYKIVDIAAAQTETIPYTVECMPWQPPAGGEDCEKCNDPMKPCSEYKCRSLGQSCQLLNKGLGNETCTSLDQNDITAPRISAYLTPLLPEYQKEVAITTDPSNPGYEIKKKLKAFTPITIGITTDEPAQCKLAPEPKKKFDEMPQYFGSTVYTYDHTTKFTIPKELVNEKVVVKNNGEYGIYVRCKDSNGNSNERDYFIKFQVDSTPDLTPPEVQYTSILNNGYVAANVTTTPFSLYINEPAECKWSKTDIAYELMESTLSCAAESIGQSSVFYGTHECKTTLEGIGLQPTNFFFKCRDQPEAKAEDRNTNADSFKFTVQGSKPLLLTSLEPKGLQYTNTITMRATTAIGAERGKASCAFSPSAVPFESMILFAKTDDVVHEQVFEGMATGDYTFNVKCRDIAGNEITNSTSFSVAIDTEAPRIQELYVDGTVLHLGFNEKSTCEYSDKQDKKYGEGTQMTNANSTTHEAALNQNNYYIKCQDQFGNQGSYDIYL